ncbi:MAG: Holliday junction branch migration protein RuvA [Calditrichaeota bacterium]|nr:Holliday junction branch migration protein RuvA [Calditrichota bacterium]MCB0269326.1 Holliday junction branch migration protein RuvA [Calditrichota bacterium]
MIERISGNIIEKTPTFCIVDCHGMGIGLHISLNTFQYLERSDASQPVQLLTYLHVREDVLQLYGFSEMSEKKLFQMLISISGVGPKLAIAILSGSSTADFTQAIAMEDVAMLTRIPGVGKKTAQRLVLELKEKIGKQAEVQKIAAMAQAADSPQRHINEAIMALSELGYKPRDAQVAIEKVVKRAGKTLSLEEIVVNALREL